MLAKYLAKMHKCLAMARDDFILVGDNTISHKNYSSIKLLKEHIATKTL